MLVWCWLHGLTEARGKQKIMWGTVFDFERHIWALPCVFYWLVHCGSHLFSRHKNDSKSEDSWWPTYRNKVKANKTTAFSYPGTDFSQMRWATTDTVLKGYSVQLSISREQTVLKFQKWCHSERADPSIHFQENRNSTVCHMKFDWKWTNFNLDQGLVAKYFQSWLRYLPPFQPKTQN